MFTSPICLSGFQGKHWHSSLLTGCASALATVLLRSSCRFLHSQGIVFADLRPDAVLLDENGRLKVSCT